MENAESTGLDLTLHPNGWMMRELFHPWLDEGLVGVFNRGASVKNSWESRFRWSTAREGVESHQERWNTAREGVECHHHFGHWSVGVQQEKPLPKRSAQQGLTHLADAA